MSGTIWDVFILLVKVVGVFAALMLTVLFTIWLERRVVAFMQTRVGPNRVGPFGVLQSLADGIKLFFKEDVRPTNADRILYALAPVIMMIPAFLAFSVVPFGFAFGTQRAQLTDLNVGLLEHALKQVRAAVAGADQRGPDFSGVLAKRGLRSRGGRSQ